MRVLEHLLRISEVGEASAQHRPDLDRQVEGQLGRWRRLSKKVFGGGTWRNRRNSDIWQRAIFQGGFHAQRLRDVPISPDDEAETGWKL